MDFKAVDLAVYLPVCGSFSHPQVSLFSIRVDDEALPSGHRVDSRLKFMASWAQVSRPPRLGGYHSWVSGCLPSRGRRMQKWVSAQGHSMNANANARP